MNIINIIITHLRKYLMLVVSLKNKSTKTELQENEKIGNIETYYNDIISTLSHTKLQTMPVYGKTIFGLDKNNKHVTFDEVREITDEDELIDLLKIRLDNYFIKQVQPLYNTSPFPLAIMCCLGIETLGQISIKEKPNEKHHQFVSILNLFNDEFKKGLNPTFEENLNKMWDNSEKVKKIDNFSRLIYTYFRNTLTHTYSAKGVYLDNSEVVSFKIVDDGYLIINSNWLWDNFLRIHNLTFGVIQNNKDSGERKQCLKYINDLLNK